MYIFLQRGREGAGQARPVATESVLTELRAVRMGKRVVKEVGAPNPSPY